MNSFFHKIITGSLVLVCIWAISFFVLSCKNQSDEKRQSTIESKGEIDSIHYFEIRDNARFNKILDSVPIIQNDIGLGNRDNHNYKKHGNSINQNIRKYEKFVIDTAFNVVDSNYMGRPIYISKGHIFDSLIAHLIVKSDKRIDVYAKDIGNYINIPTLLSEKKYSQVIHFEGSEFIEMNDLVDDFNGDGYLDYAITIYPRSGCCPRNVFHVYLYLPHCGGFTPYYEFMNPTFYIDEKIIRGVTYGQPTDAALYEKKWDGVLIKDLRKIYVNQHDTLNFTYRLFKGNGDDGYSNLDKGKLLKKIPKEFMNVGGLGWFTNYTLEGLKERQDEGDDEDEEK
jgi:hypothetical protein